MVRHQNDFEAWCACPECGTYACHRIRRPRFPAPTAPWERKLSPDSSLPPAPPPEPEPPQKVEVMPIDERIDQLFTALIAKPMSGSVHMVPLPGTLQSRWKRDSKPVWEYNYDIIRICECGKEWGQT